MKFLIDECLSPQLARLACASGHDGSSHVTWMGLAGFKDWELVGPILAGDWTFVTKNSVDFRGPAGRPGSAGQYAHVELHAGLVCLNGPVGMDLDMQRELFGAALDLLGPSGDLTNRGLEISVSETGEEFVIRQYDLPA